MGSILSISLYWIGSQNMPFAMILIRILCH
jgi:hypothetical protein